MFMIILGLSFFSAGILMLKFNRPVYNFTGNIDFVERWVTAGTPAFLKIVALLLVIIGMGMVFGIWGWLTQPIADGLRSTFGGGVQ